MAADETGTYTLRVTRYRKKRNKSAVKSATNDAINDASADKLLIVINTNTIIMVITLRTLRGGP